jgi:hypothetical protein
MTLAAVFASSTEGYALIEQAAIANFAGFTNHHSHAVIDENASPDSGARMYLDPGNPTSQLTN